MFLRVWLLGKKEISRKVAKNAKKNEEMIKITLGALRYAMRNEISRKVAYALRASNAKKRKMN
jgi:hypothetical protein